eukprot:CAMPEP_0119331732 /NCGR_PEP_ID=MMETSP1333-20130426/81276_1 /TAXON_ID=418940 /ORGANISM="Scyphosphaera apsteinii, Strain RCC1455" /LENGTH=81 /DNA_ID=CAMNT_0007341403 /DNA_START=158 /DNA_END=404 /DNA_ORIENTATION=-
MKRVDDQILGFDVTVNDRERVERLKAQKHLDKQATHEPGLLLLQVVRQSGKVTLLQVVLQRALTARTPHEEPFPVLSRASS